MPDNNLPGSSTTVYDHLRGNKYFSRSSPPQLARTSHVGPLTLLGPGVSISQDARVWSSTLGTNCIVGQGSVVSDSYLWDDVLIEAGCVVEGSILGRGVKVLKGSRIERGCLVADGVVVGPDARLRRLTRVSTKRAEIKRPAEEDSEDEDSELEDVEEGGCLAMSSSVPFTSSNWYLSTNSPPPRTSGRTVQWDCMARRGSRVRGR